MESKLIILCLGILIVLGIAGYAFFQINNQNITANTTANNMANNTSINTNKSPDQGNNNQGVSSSQGSGSKQGVSSSQGSGSNQGNSSSQGNICPTCGGNGYINYIDENGTIIVKTCPTCGGSGRV